VFASQAYYELSSKEDYKIEEENKLELLKNAVTCAVLAPVGPQKSRLLTALYKDERTRNLENVDILERMFNDKVINKELTQKFEKLLEDHQRTKGADGLTVLETAVLEHNIRVVSNIYQTISYEGLGTFLGITKDNAEKLISNMATEGRISAILDQRDEIIEFEKNEREKLGIWNEQIGLLCNDVNTILSKILNEYPEAEKHLAK
jgi:COP9 signalosome complex subunit 4